jgi:hypothetical protein
MYWLISRALYRGGSWPWLDSMDDNVVKVLVIVCVVLAAAWIAVFAIFEASK